MLGTQENPRDKFTRKSQIWGCRVLSPWWVGMEWPTIFVLFFTKYWHAQHVWARALLHTIGVMYMDVIVHPVKYVTLSLMSLAAASSAPQLPVSKKPQPVIGREKFVLRKKFDIGWRYLITSGARSAERVFCGLREKSEYARTWSVPDPTRPDPITLLRSLYLWNGLTDSRAVFFVRCHHSINFVFDPHRYPPVPATVRGTCRARGFRRHPTLDNSTTTGPMRSNLVCA